MTSGSVVPDWLIEYMSDWQDRLGLNNWRIFARIVLCVDGDEDMMASTQVYSHLNEARIDFRVDVDDTEDWRIIVIHELLHIAHSQIDGIITNVILPRLGDGQEALALEAYRQVYEPFVHMLARTLYETVQ